MSDAADKAAALEKEAAVYFTALLRALPPFVTDVPTGARIVECLVGAAVLRVADLQSQAIKRTTDSADEGQK